MAVRSRRLFGPVYVAAGLWTTLMVVPADRTAVFRFFSVVHLSGNNNSYRLGIIPSGGVLDAFWLDNLATGTSKEVCDGLVLQPGDTLQARGELLNEWLFTGAGSLLLGAPA